MGVSREGLSHPPETPLCMSYAGVASALRKSVASVLSILITKYPRNVREVNRIPYVMLGYISRIVAIQARRSMQISYCIKKISTIFSDEVLCAEEIDVVNTNPYPARRQRFASAVGRYGLTDRRARAAGLPA